METSLLQRESRRLKKVLRVRKKIQGSSEKPRLSVSRTNRHLFAQLIDDEKQITLASAGTMQKSYRSADLGKKSKEAARRIGTEIAELAKKNQIQKVVFDRGRCKYHGIIAELANAAREAGLQF